jgi:hypothetical protein
LSPPLPPPELPVPEVQNQVPGLSQLHVPFSYEQPVPTTSHDEYWAGLYGGQAGSCTHGTEVHDHAPPLQVQSGGQTPPHSELSQYWPSKLHALLFSGGEAGHLAWGHPTSRHPLLPGPPSPRGGPRMSVFAPHATAAAPTRQKSSRVRRIVRI